MPNDMIFYILGILIAILSFLLKRSLDEIDTRITDCRDYTERVDLRVDKLRDSQIENFISIMDKFSNWEDRIKKIISNIEFQDKPKSKEEVTNPFIKLDEITKKEIEGLKKEVFKLKNSPELKELKEASSEKMKNIIDNLFKIESEINDIIFRTENKFTHHSDLLRSFHAVLRELVISQKRSENQIKNMSTKIKLF